MRIGWLAIYYPLRDHYRQFRRPFLPERHTKMTFPEAYRIGKRILYGLWSAAFLIVAILGIMEGNEWAFRPMTLLSTMAIVWAIPLLVWEFLERKAFPELSRDEASEEDNSPNTDASPSPFPEKNPDTAPTSIIQIDTDAPRTSVSPDLYGIFFEEINHAGEGGLYAEMVQNRDFEYNVLPEGTHWAGNLLKTSTGWQERKWFGNALHGWKLITRGTARGTIAQESASPLNNRNPHSLRLTARDAGTRIGVSNAGFWGMNLQSGEFYELTLFARTENSDTFDLTATLESASGRESYATAVIEDVGGGWKRYGCSLQANDSDPQGRLTLTIDCPGTIWLDIVSLFPRDTFKSRPFGLRADLAQLLADLQPSFVRFPGGAIVGGLNLDNRIQWKNSIGDIAQRRGTMNLWGYYTTNGLGFHEYLQLCEDLDADALWVCNPGFSDNYRSAEHALPEEIPAFVQEALDGLEYALGPIDSEWGAQRAANGHPQPFRLRYIEIGNEARGQQYRDNYELFHRAIRDGYPNVTIISNQDFGEELPADIVDHHKYGSPKSFFDAHHQYDDADRTGPGIYVGEYACNSDVGEGNLLAALSEATYMLGLERNGDVVKMSSYAPLFFHIDDIAWPVNMIGFDSSRAFGRSSYYVQQLFAHNRPDEILPTRVELADEEDADYFYALAGIDDKTGEILLKVVNGGAVQRAATVQLSDLESVATAQVTTLGHPDPQAENSIYEPDLILPQTAEIDLPGPHFTHTFEPHSLTILRIATE
jgi:alpha-L-arabinofuranosidase